MNDKRGLKHGLRYTPEYRVWLNMRQRCNNTKNKSYSYYGGKGITICDRWNSVINFISDMGVKPLGHEIDRIDNNLGYFKENCRWVLKKPQMQNTRISKWWFVHGVKYASLSEAAYANNTTVCRIKAWCDGRNDGDYCYPPRDNCRSEIKYE